VINSDSELAAQFWEKGRLDDCPIIDFHGHMGENRSLYLPRKDPEGMLRTMDQCNVQLLFFCSHESLFVSALHRSVDIEAVRANPDRFRSYFGLNANFPYLEKDLEQLRQNPDVFIGLKMLPSYFACPINDDRYTPFYEYADEKNLLFLCHTWGGDTFCGVEETETFLKRFPNVIFIAGHALFGEWERAGRLAKKYSNFYLDTCAVMQKRGGIEILVRECGSEKILFGTDIPWFDPHQAIGDLLSAEITDEDRLNILNRNGVRLLKRYEWFQKIRPGL